MNKDNICSSGQNKPITAVIVGAGNRSRIYASYALEHPDQLKIVGVVEPNDARRNHTAQIHNIAPEFCFKSVDELAGIPQFADAVINGTMDKYHLATSVPLLRAGYHMLLEKPIGISEKEVTHLLKSAKENNRKVMICHVLRYAPFYVEVRKRVLSGEIGDVINIQTVENLSYRHMATAYVRGKWNNRDVCLSPILMAKCSHDLDIISWIKSGIKPVRVSSFGSLSYFKPERAPEGSGTRCLTDCKIERECPYSAYKSYIDNDKWTFYVWEAIEHLGKNPTTEQKIESLKTDNPYGRCVWRCDNNVADHQSVMIEYEDGCIATHNLVGTASKPCRTIHILGTTGEIEGVMEEGSFIIRHPDARPGCQYSEEIVNVDVADNSHGGGDLRLVEDFIHVLRGEKPSISSTNLEDSIYGHLIGFSADNAMLEGIIANIRF